MESSLESETKPNCPSSPEHTSSPKSKDESDDETVEKPHGGYCYWKRLISDSHILPPSTPQKIDNATTASTSSLTAVPSGMSAWNASGTWEEKNVGPKVSKALESLIINKRFVTKFICADQTSSTFITLDGITPTLCEASICFVRGKPRFGYDLSLSGTWNMIIEDDKTTINGDFSVDELTDHEEEPHTNLNISSTALLPDCFSWPHNFKKEAEQNFGIVLKSLMKEIGNELIKQ